MGKGRVVVAMSGGVDSSLAAALLKEAGYEVIGITMRLWAEESPDLPSRRRPCCLTEDVNDARRVCHILDVPYYVLNFERQFRTWVVDYFCREYSGGRTPNPCLACNQQIKFHFLLKKVLALGADYLATGHYARIDRSQGEIRLLKAIDGAKDQSYALYTLGQRELQHLLLPLGEHHKADARRMAAQRGLPVADKADSQEICFIPDGDYRPFLAQHLTPAPGEIVDTRGRVLGRHRGLAFHTVGQRRGLGLASGKRLYVVRMEPSANRLVVGEAQELLSDTLFAKKLNWVRGSPPPGSRPITAKIRYKSPEAAAVLHDTGADWVKVSFLQPQRAIAPGQAVVFYQGNAVLGGGIIDDRWPSSQEWVMA